MSDNTSYTLDIDAELKTLQIRRLKAFTSYYEEGKKLRRQLEAHLAEIDAAAANFLDKNQLLPCLVRGSHRLSLGRCSLWPRSRPQQLQGS
ncbi:hypothetical protein [Streptomyces sp. NPDC050560]|uniref:hypothetical protein n=1 Tax=Streptomyces sp. NPDC050560 TaxID=3365630 RepID=UPI0037BDEE17